MQEGGQRLPGDEGKGAVGDMGLTILLRTLPTETGAMFHGLAWCFVYGFFAKRHQCVAIPYHGKRPGAELPVERVGDLALKERGGGGRQ